MLLYRGGRRSHDQTEVGQRHVCLQEPGFRATDRSLPKALENLRGHSMRVDLVRKC